MNFAYNDELASNYDASPTNESSEYEYSSGGDGSSSSLNDTSGESYHPYLSMPSLQPLLVRVSHASEVYTPRTNRHPKLRLRMSLKRKSVEQIDEEKTRSDPSGVRTSSRIVKKKKYTDVTDDTDLLEEIDDGDVLKGPQQQNEQTHKLPNIEGPPPGVLGSLWYSNEFALHVFVIDKILGMKVRQVKDQHEGMDVSILRSQPHYRADDGCNDAHQVESSQKETEEVLLIKWRGRSYMHCTWENVEDLIRMDPTNTAKGKVKRYEQSQEYTLGPNWKQILNESQSSTDDDYFPPTFVEAERILASDETEMNLTIFAKQRGLNLKADRSINGKDVKIVPTPIEDKNENQPVLHKDDSTDMNWDPEDYVRYVVKWKGLPASDMTWEYWKDLKFSFVDIVEDYWLRQTTTPTSADIKTKAHPHVRDFKKLKESPIFGISSKQRPVIGFDDDDADSQSDEESALRLRSYQLEGVNWLLWNWWCGRSSILADEMGLGKTIQTITFLQQLSSMKLTRVRGPFLVVAPLTLIAQWQSEAASWAPDFNTIVYHGSAAARKFIADNEFYYSEPFVSKKNAQQYKLKNITKFHILVTTYEVVMKDLNVLSKIRWKALVVDEAHRLKNHKSRLFSDFANIPRDYCLLLTGTPLQNSTEEIWALLNFSEPHAFASKHLFTQQFGKLTEAKQVKALHAMLKPYLLRRVKEDVAKSLPPKEETILEVSLTPIQKAYYKAIYERNTMYLFKGAKPSNSPSLMNVMMELRKCCNHPFLIRGAEHRILAGDRNKLFEDDKSKFSQPLSSQALERYPEQLVKSSGKMVLIDKLLPKLKEGGHKVLIFSQMVRVLDLLEELLRLNRYRYERLDGSVRATSRQAAVHRFHSKTYDRFVMLLSTRAGGLGLNLTAADTVIIFDSDWNPQNDLQAMARAHRIGQTKAVRVYRLLTSKTYEMHMFHSASMKLGLDRAVLAHQRNNEEVEKKNGKTSKSEREVQAKEIDALLKKGAYDVFRGDDDEEEQKFLETDIDDLLKRSSRKVTYGKNTHSLSSGLGSFSKASFVVDSGDRSAEVDLDDPDFWQKAVGLEAPPADGNLVTEGITIESKRSRKQVQVYDPFSELATHDRKKQEKPAAKSKAEKEDRERKRHDDKKKKIDEKDKKQKVKVVIDPVKVKEFDEEISRVVPTKTKEPLVPVSTKKVGPQRESQREVHKFYRQKLIRAAYEKLHNTVICQWTSKKRDIVFANLLRFGFGRFTKVRHESDLLKLPIQDVEVFLRSCIFQCGVEGGIFLLKQPSFDTVVNCIRSNFEGEWICNAISTALDLCDQIESGAVIFRVPRTLIEKSFKERLQHGAAIYILRRVAFLSRFNAVMNNLVDEVLSEIGADELGKRGCPKDLSVLDMDTKLQYIPIDELMLWINSKQIFEQGRDECPSLWWDKKCDVALLVGSLFFGVGNYNIMRNNDSLPFKRRLELLSNDEFLAEGIKNHSRVVLTIKQIYEEQSKPRKLDGKPKEDMAVGTEDLTNSNSSNQPTALTKEQSCLRLSTKDNVIKLFPFSLKELAAKCKQSLCANLLTSDVHVEEPGCLMPDATRLDLLLYRLVNSLQDSDQGSEDLFSRKETSVDIGNMLSRCDSSFDAEWVSSIHKTNTEFNAKFSNCTAGLGYETYATQSCFLSRDLVYLREIGVMRYIDDGSNFVAGVADSSLAEFVHEYCSRESNVTPCYGFSRLGLNSLLYASTKHLDKAEIEMRNCSSRKNYVPFSREVNGPWKCPRNRARLCLALLSLGSFDSSCMFIRYDLLTYFHCTNLDLFEEVNDRSSTDAARRLLSFSDVSSLYKFDDVSENDLVSYAENILLPYCILLNIHKKKKTDFLELNCTQSFLPEPMLPLELHSSGAFFRAAAIVRRYRLCEFVRILVSDERVSIDVIKESLKLNAVDSADDLPIWWNPMMHDLGLILCSAKFGLFGILSLNRISSIKFPTISPARVFCIDSIEQHIRSTFFDEVQRHGKNRNGLPATFVEQHCNDVEEWISVQKNLFPSADVIERRIARVCSKIFSPQNKGVFGTSFQSFYNMTMYDHKF